MKFLHLVLKNILNRCLNQFYLHTFLDKPAITGSLATLGYFIVKNSSYTIIIIFSIILFTITPYAIGKIYFRFKNFNKKIGQADVLIDYKI